ncbi:DUF1778 domain-containing protein [Streptomyces sp. NPDC088732]|uniref:type II toxin -antitoxin system TacA 1-like antitoxin n=1 Tax=Streptomyces sp. NPDC088732 TaxID=3365879 RepID=UPI003811178E
MTVAHAQALAVPLTAAQQDQVQRAAATAGKSVEEFMLTAVLDAAQDPFLAALEQAVDTLVARDTAPIRHDYAADDAP